ncbi:hypothetical protein EG329_000913 [Mollisiaceae sp. DMI_Dod_QoI]|nr:hypothetical protein EG329_000913 [Helotiales sp. DMI_Dod_QoI]
MDERWKSHHVVVAGDYSSYAEMRLNGAMVEVHDVLTGLLKEDLDQKAKRMLLYQRFKKVTQDPAEPVPKYVLRSGEELDIMKPSYSKVHNSLSPRTFSIKDFAQMVLSDFPLQRIPALELGYNRLPKTKWYLLTDDDTYIHLPSILSILSTLPSTKSQYLGHANGTYNLRFADSGSGILFSQAAMARIFYPRNRKHILYAKIESLIAESGGKLLAELALKSGVYLNEEYGVDFNNDVPQKSRITKDGFCVEALGFNKLSPREMEDTAVTLLGIEDEIRWWDMWWIFSEGSPRMKELPGQGQERKGKGKRVSG